MGPCLSYSGVQVSPLNIVPSGPENFRTLALFPRGPKFISSLTSQLGLRFPKWQTRNLLTRPLNPRCKDFRLRSPRGALRTRGWGSSHAPAAGPGFWVGEGTASIVTSALLWCSVQSLLVGVERETPSGGGNKTARSPAPPATASLRAVARAPPSSCQVSAPRGRPPRVPATARAPGTHPAPIGFSGPVAALQEKFVGRVIPGGRW